MGASIDPAACLDAARNWGRWADSRQAWHEGREAYAFGLDAMGNLFRKQLVRHHKETWLIRALGLPSQAAFGLAQAEDLTAAVVAIEYGRALLLSEATERDRNVVLRLHEERRSDLVERYDAAVSRWDESSRGRADPFVGADVLPRL